ncbi:peptide ABC transporter substrate-binding protein [Actinomyces qiguomingii]|uniref:peptide ABC transporter substrate-binding protein n=1 Tax=Actinomyces qiguomingii TaxID=2057800 RepID=UPI000CA007DC|nr:ABC transporter substrate-binding protein [Actinomyces qiguomingii]
MNTATVVSRRAFGIGAASTAVLLSLAACGSNNSDDSAASNSVLAYGTEPQNPLIPSNTNEVGGGRIVDLLFAGLFSYDADGGIVNEVAKDITTDDNQTFTVTLNEGWTFSDGTPVTADSFINAWNYGALLSHAHLSSYFYEPIQGFSYDEDSELTGLKKVSDTEFTITLTEPQSDFPLRLGYSAFYPLPESAYDDMDAFGQNPVGNGPYTLSSWTHNDRAELVTNPDYAGPRKAANEGITFVFYTDYDAAYADLQSDAVDVLDAIPDSALATFKDDLADRAVNEPGAVVQCFSIDVDSEHFKMDQEGRLRRRALSLAVNRQEICDTIYNETRTPASDFTSPVIDGWTEDVEGNEVLTYDPDAAKEAWAAADAISPFEGEFTIAYNADGPHKTWVDAVCNSIKNTLGIEASGKSYPTFQELRDDIHARAIKSGFRNGWQADYPSMSNFLGAVYQTGAGSNDAHYANAEFDGLLKGAAQATDPDEALKLYKQAQTILLTDLPAIPLWYQNGFGGYSSLVSNVEWGWNSVPLYYAITKA